MKFQVFYAVMGHNNDRECYRAEARWKAEQWIKDKFDNAPPHSGIVEYYIREVWTNDTPQEEWD